MQPEQDLRHYWRILMSRKQYFLGTALAIVLVAAVVALALPPIYESTATILIDSKPTG